MSNKIPDTIFPYLKELIKNLNTYKIINQLDN